MPKIIPVGSIENIRNKVTELNGSVTDEQYPSAKAVQDALANVTSTNKDLPISKSSGSNSLIINDLENNRAYSSDTTAIGYNTIAGSNAFKITNVDYENLTLTLLDTTSLAGLITESNTLEYSCQLSNNYSKCGKIVEVVDETIVKVDKLPTDTTSTAGTLWIPSNPELGDGETVVGTAAFAAGYANKALQVGSATFGYNNIADGKYALVTGNTNSAGYASAVFGQNNKGEQWSLVGGYKNTVTAPFAFTAGNSNNVNNQYASALGYKNTVSGEAAIVVNGSSNNASGTNSFAGGVNSKSTNDSTFAFGNKATAGGKYATAIGFLTEAPEDGSVAIGWGTKALKKYSAAFGINTQANAENQFVCGRWNAQDTSATFIVANGTKENPSNLFTVKTDGSAEVKTMGKNTNSIATKNYVDTEISKSVSNKLTKQLVSSINGNKVIINGTEQDAVDSVIYLLKDDTAIGDDTYKEYTLIGTPAVLTLIGDTSTKITYTNSEPLLNDIGGIKASEHPNGFDNVPIIDLLTELLYPYTKPVIGSFTLNPTAGVKEKGVAITLNSASAKITKKSKAISKVDLYKGSTLIASSTDEITSAGTTINFTNLNDALDGNTNTTYTIKVSEKNGTADVITQSATYTFVSPYYYGVINKNANIDETLISGLSKVIESKGSKNRTYTTTSEQCAVIAYPASYGNLSSIKDPNGFTQTWTKHTVALNSVSYFVYVSGAAAATDCKYVFSY